MNGIMHAFNKHIQTAADRINEQRIREVGLGEFYNEPYNMASVSVGDVRYICCM